MKISRQQFGRNTNLEIETSQYYFFWNMRIPVQRIEWLVCQLNTPQKRKLSMGMFAEGIQPVGSERDEFDN